MQDLETFEKEFVDFEDFRVDGMSCDKAGILVDTITKKYYTF